MKRYLLLLPLYFISISGCGDNSVGTSNAQTTEPNDIRTVTLRSHLIADVTVDPVLHLDETIRVQPDNEEPFTSHEALDVKLPRQAPYTGHHAQQYLRGYAVGQASRKNGQFL